MKFDLEFERVYPHPVETVWRALTEPDALGEWLMKTDFVPEAGREFRMWCDDGAGGTDLYLCQVLEIEPPRRMLWSWILDGRQDLGATFVEITVDAAEHGTQVTIRHSGDRDRRTIESFRGGWPYKLGQLADVLGASRAARNP